LSKKQENQMLMEENQTSGFYACLLSYNRNIEKGWDL